MDRNFRTFLILSLAMLLIFMGLQKMFLPNPPGGAPKREDNASLDPREPVRDKGGVASQKTADGKAADGKAADETGDPERPNHPERVVTLGSMDPSTGYRLLVTLTSRGAGLERVELVDEKKIDRFRYRAIEHRSGYLGYLGWRPTTSGVLITTIPAGSPAAVAKSTDTSGGLMAGDVLNAVGDQNVTSYNSIQKTLRDTKPGETVALAVTRTVDGEPKKLTFEVTLSQPPLDVLRTQEYLSEQVPGNLDRLSCLTTLASIGDEQIPIGARTIENLAATITDNWEVNELDVPGGQGVEFRLPLASYLKDAKVPADLVMVKRYRVFPYKADAANEVAANADAYSIDFETVVENHSDSPIDLSLRHEALAGITLEGWWYSVKVSPYFFRGAGQRDIRFGDAAGNHAIVLARSVYDREQKSSSDPGLFVDAGGNLAARSLRYVGLDTQYFAAAFLPHSAQPDALNNLRQAGSEAIANVKMMVSSQAQAVNTAFWFDTSPSSVAPGDSLSTRYRVFAGPKDTAMLRHFGMERFIEYGWIPWIAKPLSAILYFFYNIVRNYGIAIIMLTLLVRGCMFPLGRQAAVNAQKMQELQPEMKRINELYKEDMQKRAEATRELYKKHNFRPLASCGPMFLQIPIFMGLYRCLSVDISLRQEPLIPGITWCSNLAGPDMLFDWSGWMPEIIAGRGTGYLGPYFNILPVITVVLFLVQQKVLMPKPTDEQMQMTQNMMQIMTIFMGVLFFKVPSGLCIYFITSSLWSLVERKLVKRMVPVKAPVVAAATTPTARPAPPTNPATRKSKEPQPTRPQSGMAAKLAELREMLDKPAVRSATQRRDPDKNKKRKR